MTIWIALVLSGYGLHLVWQCFRILRRSKPTFVGMLPFFLLKLALLAVACSYWLPGFCPRAKILSPWFLPLFAAMAIGELCIAAIAVKENIRPIVASPRFLVTIAAQLLVSVVFPAALLVVVYNLLATSKCGW